MITLQAILSVSFLPIEHIIYKLYTLNYKQILI